MKVESWQTVSSIPSAIYEYQDEFLSKIENWNIHIKQLLQTTFATFFKKVKENT